MEHERTYSAQYISAPNTPSGQPADGDRRHTHRSVFAELDPMELLLRAYDALDQGILVVSQEGLISHYNTAYAQLRNITMGTLVGQPIETIDRRGDLRALLRSGKLPSAKPVAFELRQNRETLLPLHDHGRLIGGMLLVTPVNSRLALHGVSRRVQTAKTPWGAQYSAADIIGNSPALVYARELAMKAAQSNASVLLLGESGTGKELFAHAIHMASSRCAHPFVPVDCSAISRELIEAELFGYASGAFTGAAKEGKPGKFELANGGTVFLDEIGEMPLEMQAKLLRVLQERRVVRVGGTLPLPVDFRVIAATNRDLESMAADARFRQDLLYRLDVIRIEIPALRERPDDIPFLLEHIWQQKSRELGIVSTLSAKAVRALTRYLWPGNIRELLNMVERLLVSASKSVIELDDLPSYIESGQATTFPDAPALYLRTVVAEAERQALEKALRHAQGNRNTAAELVGLSRASFYRKLKEYGLTHSLREQDAFE